VNFKGLPFVMQAVLDRQSLFERTNVLEKADNLPSPSTSNYTANTLVKLVRGF
jgi:hypothetical protein